MNKLNSIQTWKLKTITPLHVGDGEELVHNMDYISGKHGLEIIEVDSMIDEASSIPGAVNEIGQDGFDLNNFLKAYKISPKIKYDLNYNGKKVPSSLRSFIKDAFGRPYVPGSSLKGAFRTALQTMCLKKEKLPNVNSKEFDKKEKELFGKTHNDFLRPLQVSDSTLADPEKILEAVEIKYLNILKGDRPGWIDFGSQKRSNRTSPQEVFGAVAEVIREEQEFYLTTCLDGFLTEDAVNSAAKIPCHDGVKQYKQLCKQINAHSLDMATKEKKFFEQFESATRDVKDFYDKLIKRILHASDKQDTIITRLAWGSGWKGMTGDWIPESELEEKRRKFNLGKVGCPYCGFPKTPWVKKINKFECKNCDKTFSEKWLHHIFPKTRRLAFLNNESLMPLGWVELTAAERGNFRNFEVLIQKSELEETQSSEEDVDKVQPQEQGKTQEEINQEKLDDFNKFLKAIKNVPSQINEIENRIKAEENDTLRSEMVKYLVQLVKNSSNYKKAKKQGKSWIQRVYELAGENGINVE